jgi:hypothetical protein
LIDQALLEPAHSPALPAEFQYRRLTEEPLPV